MGVAVITDCGDGSVIPKGWWAARLGMVQLLDKSVTDASLGSRFATEMEIGRMQKIIHRICTKELSVGIDQFDLRLINKPNCRKPARRKSPSAIMPLANQDRLLHILDRLR